MKNFVVYNEQGGILRTGMCQSIDFFRQACDNEFVMEGKANITTQKVINPGIDGKIVDKTPEEIEADNPPPLEISPEKKPAMITKKQWQDILDRLDDLEKN